MAKRLSQQRASVCEKDHRLFVGRIEGQLPLWKNQDADVMSEVSGVQTSVGFLAGVGAQMRLAKKKEAEGSLPPGRREEVRGQGRS